MVPSLGPYPGSRDGFTVGADHDSVDRSAGDESQDAEIEVPVAGRNVDLRGWAVSVLGMTKAQGVVTRSHGGEHERALFVRCGGYGRSLEGGPEVGLVQGPQQGHPASGHRIPVGVNRCAVDLAASAEHHVDGVDRCAGFEGRQVEERTSVAGRLNDQAVAVAVDDLFHSEGTVGRRGGGAHPERVEGRNQSAFGLGPNSCALDRGTGGIGHQAADGRLGDG